ncbi:hypothetical protein AVEN_139560-1 [Araneus ventricosus]|uniref:Uncharacterized protein n=1 Tax=Araneus ventricosus TaxID=182803 RepID=A0A4Y2TVX2_ARAVE|nr:hypothetical protein AVEN_139560-1 [Araneus ventricosus]
MLLQAPERHRIFSFRRWEVTRTADEICGLSDRGSGASEFHRSQSTSKNIERPSHTPSEQDFRCPIRRREPPVIRTDMSHQATCGSHLNVSPADAFRQQFSSLSI